jgi:hypothetical protein
MRPSIRLLSIALAVVSSVAWAQDPLPHKNPDSKIDWNQQIKEGAEKIAKDQEGQKHFYTAGELAMAYEGGEVGIARSELNFWVKDIHVGPLTIEGKIRLNVAALATGAIKKKLFEEPEYRQVVANKIITGAKEQVAATYAMMGRTVPLDQIKFSDDQIQQILAAKLDTYAQLGIDQQLTDAVVLNALLREIAFSVTVLDANGITLTVDAGKLNAFYARPMDLINNPQQSFQEFSISRPLVRARMEGCSFTSYIEVANDPGIGSLFDKSGNDIKTFIGKMMIRDPKNALLDLSNVNAVEIGHMQYLGDNASFTVAVGGRPNGEENTRYVYGQYSHDLQKFKIAVDGSWETMADRTIKSLSASVARSLLRGRINAGVTVFKLMGSMNDFTSITSGLNFRTLKLWGIRMGTGIRYNISFSDEGTNQSVQFGGGIAFGKAPPESARARQCGK